MPRALITCMHLTRHFKAFESQYAEMGVETVIPPLEGQQFNAEEMAQHLVGVDAVIAGDDEIDARALDVGQASGLKAVIKWGIGTDGIDKAHAKKIGMPVYNTPGAFSEEVGDLAMSHLLMLSRKTHLMHQSVLDGGWLKVEGHSLAGLTAGVVGLGGIGRAITRRALGFGMEVVGSDPFPPAADILDPRVQVVDFDSLMARADVVFAASALTSENRHLFNKTAFDKAKEGIYFINVARGPLVDEAALVAALESGKVKGAGLDVFETEPLPMEASLRAYADRCTFSTHNGSNTQEAVARINQMTTDILFDLLGLKPCEGFVPNRVA